MSTLLLLVFFSILLFVGFGFGAWSLVALTLLLTFGIAYMMVSVDIEAIKANWAEKRCDIDVMFMGYFFKPASDPRTSVEFMNENFSFCTRSIFKEAFQVLLTPLLAVLGKQLDTADVLTQMLNVLRTLKSNAVGSFQKLLDPFWKRFVSTGIQFSQVSQRLLSAMNRVAGIAMATLYMGIGIQTGMENFANFIVKLVIIVLNVLVALVAILFFILFPLIPLVILPTISMLEEAGYGDKLGGLRDGFCFVPDTEIVLKDTRRVRMLSLKQGDVLSDGSIVEGVLYYKPDYTNESIYDLDGVKVSGSHLVNHEYQWMPVSKHPRAILTTIKATTLICLRTSTRNILINGLNFKDWEEIPDTLTNNLIWDSYISSILNNRYLPSMTPSSYPLLGSDCMLQLKTGERIPASTIRIGDQVYGDQGFTYVTGIYYGGKNRLGSRSISDGVWTYNIQTNIWEHIDTKDTTKESETYHFVTESGTFWIDSDEFSGFIRDFTEVGEALPTTYDFMLSIINKAVR